jgi:hypothetical protein
MTLTSHIAHDTLAARRFRRLAPLIALLSLMGLIWASGFITRLGQIDRAAAASSVASLEPDGSED